jgi:NAD(P)H-hydrate epimerase
MDLVLEHAARVNALLVGCGLGRDPETQDFVRGLLDESTTPAVIDADGLNALVGFEDRIAESSSGQWILTPHWGEFKRLAGNDKLDTRDRLALAGEYAKTWNCVLILKGIPSAIGLPDGRCFLGGAGNTALATAGTGDVLAGLCAGFRAQGLSAKNAALAGLHVGGLAADLYVLDRSEAGMTAIDQLDLLSEALTYLTKNTQG